MIAQHGFDIYRVLRLRTILMSLLYSLSCSHVYNAKYFVHMYSVLFFVLLVQLNFSLKKYIEI